MDLISVAEQDPGTGSCEYINTRLGAIKGREVLAWPSDC